MDDNRTMPGRTSQTARPGILTGVMPAEGRARLAAEVGVLLRRFRSAAGLSQQELAERAGLSLDAVSAIERGRRLRPHPQTLRRLGAALGLSTEQRALLLEAAAGAADGAPSESDEALGDPGGRADLFQVRDEPWPADHTQSPCPPVVDPALRNAADQLAEQVRRQWEQAAANRRLIHPAPLRIRWRWSSLSVTGPIAEAATSPASGIGWFPPLPGLSPVTEERLLTGGHITDLFALYGGLGSGRLMVIGAAGAGKSGAAVRLVLEALAHRARLGGSREQVPVPALLTVHGWDPVHESVDAWLARRLARDYPLLRARAYGADAALRLIHCGLVAVVLDGLDEMPAVLQPVAMQALGEQARFRLVVLARSREVAAAAPSGHLLGAAAIELQPVTPDEATGYLEGCLIDPPPAGWRSLMDDIRQHPVGPVAAALDAPLMVSLARDVYRSGDAAAELLDRDRFPSAEAVESHLLDRVLTTAYEARPGQRMPRYTAAQATRWLGHLARQMNEGATRDLLWWDIPRWMPTWQRAIMSGVVTGLAYVPAGAVSAILGGDAVAAAALRFGIVSAVCGAVMSWVDEGRPPQHFGRRSLGLAFQRQMVVRAILCGLIVGSAGLITLGVRGGAVLGFGVALAYYIAHGFTQPSSTDGSPIDPPTSWRRDRLFGIVYGLAAGVAYGLGGLVAFGPASGLALGCIAVLAVGLVYPRTWRLTLASLQAARHGLAPVRMMRFLEDARARHVLRVAGPVYQFRHARLQDRLANATEARAPGPESGASG